MLATNDPVDVDDYVFKSSPESSGDDSFISDYLDNPSDEDFLQQLSSDLDIPLFLNPGEEEISLLNSFLDKSPEEILSEITAPILKPIWDEGSELDELHQLDLTQFGPEAFPNIKAEIKPEPGEIFVDECSFSDSRSSNSPTSSHSSEGSKSPLQTQRIKDEESAICNSLISPETNIFAANANDRPTQICVNNSNSTVLTHQSQQMVQNLNVKILKLPPKRIAITPKTPYTIPANKNKKIVIVPSTTQVPSLNSTNILSQNIVNNPPSKVVILDNVRTTVPVTVVNNFKPVTTVPQITAIPNPVTISNVSNIATTCVSIPTVSPPIQKKQDVPINIVSTRGHVVDNRALKRQQRMIKNRESACLSRKKKKDYVTSLELKVQQLTEENERLELENKQLKQQVSQQSRLPILNLPSKTITKTLAVCALFCVMSLNISYLQNPLISRNSGSSAIKSEQLSLHDHHGRSLLWASELEDSQSTPVKKNKTAEKLSLPMCPMNVNQSESVRLALELHRLIGKPYGKPYNISNELYKNARFGKKSSSKKEKRLQSRSNSETSPVHSSSVYKINRRNKKVAYSSINNELQIFSPTQDKSYAEFFEAINRRDDTFYLVSLSPDHLLLPALNHNKTRRPKMSLLLPSMLPNVSSTSQASTVSLMQIDCEVLDTRLLHVKYGAIPQHLRAHGNATQEEPYSNTSDDNNVQDSNTTRDNNYTVNNSSYKPYFMRKSYLKFRDTADVYNNGIKRQKEGKKLP